MLPPSYQLAIQAAKRSLELTPLEMNLPGPTPSDLAIIAMSEYKLGNLNSAKQFRDKAAKAMKEKVFSNDSENESFFDELAKLF